MSNNNNSGSSFWNVLGAIGAGVLAVGGVAAIGAAAMHESEKDAKNKREFMEKVNARLQFLGDKFKGADTETQKLIKDEISRLVTVQSEYRTADFDELNQLFDVIVGGGSIVEIVKATEKRNALLSKKVEPTVSFNMNGATRNEIYKEIERINERLSDIWTSHEEKQQLLKLRETLYTKLY